MRPVMYIFANRGLGMSPGKLAAQVAHAAVEAYRTSDTEMVQKWESGGHYTKLVMLAEDEVHLHNIKIYLEERGFRTRLIIDEGRTEIRPHSATALGVEIVDKDDEHTADTLSSFKTYKERGYHVYAVPDIHEEDALRRLSKWYLNRLGRRKLKAFL